MFCLQTEDGIRDIVRSSGLEDVYEGRLYHLDLIKEPLVCRGRSKRPWKTIMTSAILAGCSSGDESKDRRKQEHVDADNPFTYTHLTLLTS